MSLRRVFNWWHRWRQDRDRAEEMRAHFDHAVQYFLDRGLSPDHARREARLRFGNPRAHREGVDDMNRLPILDVLGRDVRYAIRRLSKAPGFSATVILTLALTIGAASAVFSLADAILLRPLPLPQADRLAVLGYKRVTPTGVYIGPSVDGAMWAAVRDHAKLVDAAVSSRGAQGVNFVLGSTPSFVQNQTIGAGYFRVLGVHPLIGREFESDEAQPGGPAVAIVSHGFWQKVFGGNNGAVGQSVLLRGEPYTVVGVMPAGFEGL